MQEKTKRVANMRDLSPEAKAKVEKNLEKLSFDARIGIPGWEHGAGPWIWTGYKCNQLKPKSACASSSGISLDIYKNYMKQLEQAYNWKWFYCVSRHTIEILKDF